MDDIVGTELKRAIEKRRKAKMMVAAVPCPGIWYYVYLKPTWRLYTICGEYGHVELWPAIVNGMMKKHYKLDKGDIALLEEAPYCFPRGRCSFVPTKKVWALYHGNDFPSPLGESSEKKKLIGEFNLTSLFLENRESVVFAEDDHERMGDEDQRVVQTVLGKVPY